ncbi:MAG: 4a-hydroxytetrahydrobiopterin dehydratase [Flavobacteriales bacterium]|jgi:4a-hydroxytetrahydrobiopterin dehydratase
MEKYTKVTALPFLERLDEWYFNNDGIEKKFVFDNFVKAMGFMVQVGILAEKQGHHPEIVNVYNKVNLRLTTHDADGLTIKDFDLATAIEKLF